MRKLAIIVFAVFCTMLVHTRAEALVDLKVGARYWFTDFDSEVQVTDDALVGTEIDLLDDLGFKDEDFLEINALIGLGGHKIRFAYMPLSWDGKQTITQDIDFGGETYSAGAFVRSNLDIDYYRLGYEYDIIDTLGNRVGLILELKYLDVDMGLRDDTVLDESESFSIPFPAIGVTAQFGIPIFNVAAEITGIGFGSDAYFIDAEASINVIPFPFMTLSGGYRIAQLHYDDDDDLVEFTVDGPFVMLRVGF